MLNHFCCEPLKNVFCFVRNRLMLDDAMNSVYSGKRYLFQLACLSVVFFFSFFFWFIYVSVSAAIKCCSQSYVFVGFFSFWPIKTQVHEQQLHAGISLAEKRLENQQKTPIVWICLLFA